MPRMFPAVRPAAGFALLVDVMTPAKKTKLA